MNEQPGGTSSEQQNILPAPLICALCAMAGLVAAMLCVYAGTGWLDGFQDWDLHRIGRRFRRALYWALPLAATAGLALHIFYRAVINKQGKTLLSLLAVVRAFVHFPLYGAAILLAMVGGLVFNILALMVCKLAEKTWGDENEEQGLATRLMVLPLWFLTLPFTLLKIPMESDLDIPNRIAQRRLRCWLPFIFLLIALLAGAESENTGERTDPLWLVAAAAFWIGDYFVAAFYVTPALKARALRRRTNQNQQPLCCTKQYQERRINWLTAN